MSNNWQDRIYNHEETPPKSVWDAIAKELDKNEKEKSPEKKNNTKIIYWKIAAAASVIFVLIATALYFNKPGRNSKPDAASVPAVHSPKKIVKSLHTDIKPALASAKTKSTGSDSFALKTSPLKCKKIISPFHTKEKVINLQPTMYAKSEESKPQITNPEINYKEKLKDINGKEINDIALMNTPNSYISFIGPNGQEVKLSSKFSNIIGYLNNPETEEYLDKVISESAFWRNKFKQWRDKMTSNSLAPSPSNFMDIIELSKLLSESK